MTFLLKRFLFDTEMYTPKRKRCYSLNEHAYTKFTVSSNQKCVDGTTSSCLEFGDQFRTVCREFTNKATALCNLINQMDTICTDQIGFNFIVCQANEFLGVIEKDAHFVQTELLHLGEKLRKVNSMKEKHVTKKVFTKKEVKRNSLSTIKRSQEELTNDTFSSEQDLLNNVHQKNKPAAEEGYDLIAHLLGDYADSLLTVKEEIRDDESIFSQTTGILGEEEEQDTMTCVNLLDQPVENGSTESLDFLIETQRIDNTPQVNGCHVRNVERMENEHISEETHDSDKSTLVYPMTHENSNSQNAIDNCDNLDGKNKHCSNPRNALTKKEIAEQLKFLQSMYSISDIENIYGKSDIELSDSEEEYEPKCKKIKKKASPINQDEEGSLQGDQINLPDTTTIQPCLVKISLEEREICDNYTNKKSVNKPRIEKSSDTSDLDSVCRLKPLQRRKHIFSSDDTISNQSSEKEEMESDEEHNSFTLSLPPPENDEIYTEEEKNGLAILNGIIDSDSISSDDESSENEISDVKKNKKKVLKHKKHEIKEGSEWKKDSLLTTSLNENSRKNAIDTDSTSGQETKDAEVDEVTISEKLDLECDEEEKGKNPYVFELSTDSSSSEIQFIDLPGNPVGKLPGRRNIRALLSEDILELSTKQAMQEENERIERLEEKQKNMALVLSELDETGLFLDASKNIRIKVNPLLASRLKSHQKAGVEFMWDACYETVERVKDYPGAGCILAHCMGLGKTFQVVTLVHTLFKYSEATKTKYVLVVCPLSTVYNWKNEFQIALDVAEEDTIEHIYIISDQQKTRVAKMLVILEWYKTGGVLIMCYEAFVRFSSKSEDTKTADDTYKALLNPGPDLIICDEGHQLKNAKALRSQMLMKTKSRRRIVLTGTPLQNNLKEYYHMVQFVKPNILGTFKEYMNRFVNPIINGQYDDSTDLDIKLMKMRSYLLHSILKKTIQRFEVTELEKYLPTKLDYVLFVKLHPVQVKLYKKYMDTIRPNTADNKLFAHYNDLRPTWVHPSILQIKDSMKPVSKKKISTDIQAIERLIQLEEDIYVPNEVPVGWWKDLTPDDYETNMDYGPKFKIIMSIIKECEKVNEQLLIFSQFLADLDLIERFFKLTDPSWCHGVNYLRMDGKLGMEARQNYCNKFNEPGSPIKLFLLTHKVGGLGLNFASANRVILMDVCWNPAYDIQSIFRIYRFGQIKPCYIYRLVSLGTMEEVVYERSVTKLAISGRVVDEMQISRHYKSTDLVSLYRCKLDEYEERPIPKLPADDMLARLLQIHESEIYKYHEHQSLLENLIDEELDEEDIKLAWEQFNYESEPPSVPPPQNIKSTMPLNQQIVANLETLLTNIGNGGTKQQYNSNIPTILRKSAVKPSTSSGHKASITNNDTLKVSTSNAPRIHLGTDNLPGHSHSNKLTNNINKPSGSNVAIALPSNPRDTLKRFDLKYVQNSQTGREDIQLVNTTNYFKNGQNNMNKQQMNPKPSNYLHTIRKLKKITHRPYLELNRNNIINNTTKNIGNNVVNHINMRPNELNNGILPSNQRDVITIQDGQQSVATKTGGVVEID